MCVCVCVCACVWGALCVCGCAGRCVCVDPWNREGRNHPPPILPSFVRPILSSFRIVHSSSSASASSLSGVSWCACRVCRVCQVAVSRDGCMWAAATSQGLYLYSVDAGVSGWVSE
eukprot:GHVU01107318.1.p3 GENE.GHVU01107318.1~~GHVU01107318.1.p3  ORF type:complete len:116 (-),score=8.51 GHVU01107318.1:51-398(-)